MVKIPDEISELFNDFDSVKFLGTVDEEGVPNTVFVQSLSCPPMADDDMLAFADLWIDKTRHNLETTKKATATVYKPPIKSFQLKGKFEGYETSGSIYEFYNEFIEQAKYNCYQNFDRIGKIKVEEIYLAQPPIPGKKALPKD